MQTQQTVFRLTMVALVGALWIVLGGVVAIALTHDGQAVGAIIDIAGKLTALMITAVSALAGLQVFVTRPAVTQVAPTSSTAADVPAAPLEGPQSLLGA